jgi:hypothetical protein
MKCLSKDIFNHNKETNNTFCLASDNEFDSDNCVICPKNVVPLNIVKDVVYQENPSENCTWNI